MDPAPFNGCVTSPSEETINEPTTKSNQQKQRKPRPPRPRKPRPRKPKKVKPTLRTSQTMQRQNGILSVRIKDEVEMQDSDQDSHSDKEWKEPKGSRMTRAHKCHSCGAKFSTHFKIDNLHARCYKCQRKRTVSLASLEKHEQELRELEGNVRLNNNGWFAGQPDHHEGKALAMSSEDYTRTAKATQTLISNHELWWERIVEDLAEDPVIWATTSLSPAQKKAKYWSRGRSLVAGGMSWTMEEGDLFFQALRRFGKHNVWAIQEHVKTRSLAEVVTMIQTMEAEVARRKYFGLDVTRLSEMPMAEEADEEQMEIEEKCSELLVEREALIRDKAIALEAWERNGEDLKLVTTTTTKARERSLINRDLLMPANQWRFMDRKILDGIQVGLRSALKEWLTPIIKELAELYHERRRVFRILNKNQDRPAFLHSLAVTGPDVWRTLYAQRKPIYLTSFFDTVPERLLYKDSEKWLPDTETSMDEEGESSKRTSLKRKRSQDEESRPSHDNSGPIITGNPRLDRVQHLRDIQLEREDPPEDEWEDEDASNGPPEQYYHHIQLYEKLMEDTAEVPTQVRLEDVNAPGYGILPFNASFMHDPTRAPPKNGYGLGKRDQGGLWLMDKRPNQIFDDDGYITVSDTEDEEEEERGWKRQMRSDQRIERAWG
ncbi:hypothetical protein BGX31_005437 [Mortierella sp. GBA43]|nr:hypothetical protein BGX31_005437 [Mortierella sp. GBA43]